jgi:hypothetical protein
VALCQSVPPKIVAMAPAALLEWNSARAMRLDELFNIHATAGGTILGRRWRDLDLLARHPSLRVSHTRQREMTPCELLRYAAGNRSAVPES